MGAQIINTIAGGGSGAIGGPAVGSSLASPFGITFDSYGNYYFSQNNETISKVSIDGIITTIAGDGTAGYSGDGELATNSEINRPYFIAVDRHQNIYFTDGLNNRVREINGATGIITTIAGNGIAGYTGDGGSADSAELNLPFGLCLDSAGNVYFSDQNNYCVRKIDSHGVISTYAGTGIFGISSDGGLADTTELGIINGLYSDATGNIYVSDGNRVRKIDVTTHIISTVAGSGATGIGGDGGMATDASFKDVMAIVVDDKEDIYIADDFGQNVRKVDTAGVIHLIAGDGTAGFTGDGDIDTAAELNLPEGVAIDPCGNLFICDLGNDRIRKVTFPDTVSISLSGPATAARASSVTVSAAVGGAGTYSIHWYDHGALVATTTSPAYTYTMNSTADTITATIISAGGCYDSVTSAAHIVTVNDNAVQQVSAQPVTIYPNPAHEQVTITGAIQQAELSNALGQVLITQSGSRYRTVIDISQLPAGLYILTTTAMDNSKMTSKIVKE